MSYLTYFLLVFLLFSFRQMTSGELKFALRVEATLNSIPVPEFRQLLVETLEILSMVKVNYLLERNFGGEIRVEDIVRRANTLFLKDQARGFKIVSKTVFIIIFNLFPVP